MRARNPPGSLSSQPSDCPGQGLLLKGSLQRGLVGRQAGVAWRPRGCTGWGASEEVRMREAEEGIGGSIHGRAWMAAASSPSPPPWRAGQARQPLSPQPGDCPGQRGPACLVQGADLPPSFLAESPGGRRPCPAAPAGTSPPHPISCSHVATSIQSSPPPTSSDFGATVPKGPPSFLHGLRQ